jgi:small-conductance mechanosensitive channel
MQWVIKTRQRIVVFGLLALVAVAIVTLVLTRDSSSPTSRTKPRRAPLVDEQPVQTARSIATLASTWEEQRFAQQALRLADHAVDLAFADALREASLRPITNPEAKELFARVRRAEAQVKSDQELIDGLKEEATKSKGSPQEIQQQVDLVQAQMELDKDDLEDAKGDLARSGADPMSRIQRQFARYQSAQQQGNATSTQTSLPGADAGSPSHNLIAQFRAWRAERANAAKLQQARDEALQKREQLQERYTSTDQAETAQPNGSQSQAPTPSTGSSQDQAVIATLHRLSEHHKNLTDLSKRIQDHQDLADVYGNWLGVVQLRQRATIRGFIQSALLILLIVLGVYLVDLAADRFFADFIPDRRRVRTLRVIVHFAVQAVGLLLVVLVVLGIPNQMPTILGLAGAGLTVALKDFIVAFFGWFALMGRNGIRVGDWVEIQGVVGEVAEISLLRTVLLETGNWNDAGHPTGRKVAFVNSFAIEGHYFNFSTSGQWLWDELQIFVPSAENPYPILDAIQKLVTTATEADARTAEEEWQRATQRERIQAVSAAPAINLRPTGSGVEVHVRYITRANERYATRTRLYQDIVGWLHQRPPETAAAGSPVQAGT